MLQRMMPPGNEPIAALAEEFNVTVTTLYVWRREAQSAGVAAPGNERPADAWSAEFKLAVSTSDLVSPEMSKQLSPPCSSGDQPARRSAGLLWWTSWVPTS
ncbi:MAG: helix-turn-helix domain containing protein [Pigmentiphaga sp.]|nr:helix-turn-helix domain containing protein [Pigmentiphaga sp.]